LASATGATIKVIAVPNRLFGASVTVAGLVAGRDIREALRGKELGAGMVIPDVMLKEGEGRFIDDVTVAELSESLGCEVLVVPATPWGVYEGLKRHAERLISIRKFGSVNDRNEL
jgi:NifB/MoaA-like Fe-S oxidoreductase